MLRTISLTVAMMQFVVVASIRRAVDTTAVRSNNYMSNVPSNMRKLSTVDLNTCTPVAQSDFNIQVINMGSVSVDPDLVSAFDTAASRWSSVIVGDVAPNFNAGTVADWFDGEFSQAFNGAVDDLVIGFEVGSIDGPGGTLAQAGAVFVRRNIDGSQGAPISGIMRFDQVDAANMPLEDFTAIVLHEMGHVLGLVTSNRCTASCNPINPFQQSGYSCQKANDEYEALALNPGDVLLLENNGGRGTACSHWEENVFRTAESSELMTGFFEANLFQPLSLVTVAGLDDLEFYEVDYCAADIWPANSTTQQRFQVYQTNKTWETGNITDNVPPTWLLDESGERTPYLASETPSQVPSQAPSHVPSQAPSPTPTSSSVFVGKSSSAIMLAVVVVTLQSLW